MDFVIFFKVCKLRKKNLVFTCESNHWFVPAHWQYVLQSFKRETNSRPSFQNRNKRKLILPAFLACAVFDLSLLPSERSKAFHQELFHPNENHWNEWSKKIRVSNKSVLFQDPVLISMFIATNLASACRNCF